jgi:hypothetical protein
MKEYPYIYSLSTIGLIHHYNNDYLFNRVRTDFTGDSGTGKSMIADLLQLIFVGSTEFEAATESIDEKRKPKGMVLNDKKRGLSGKGYVFINVAVEENQYLIIGMYLENSTNYTKPFIIHKGFDIDNPDFLKAPLLHESILSEQSILPIEDLKVYLRQQGFTCETMQLFSYHKFLFNQEILPFDLTDDPSKVKAYALIIRSFSRGKGFKFDNKHLQDFLFGTEKEKEILSNYNQQIENIKSSLEDSQDYQKQVKELKRKRTAIEKLINLDKQCVQSRNDLLNIKFIYFIQSLDYKRKKLSEITPKLSKILLEVTLLEKRDVGDRIRKSEKQVSDIEQFLIQRESGDILKEKVEFSQKVYDQRRTVKTKIEVFEGVLGEFEYSIERLKEYFALQQKNTEDKGKLESFINELKQKGVFDAFVESAWSKDYDNASSKYEQHTQELKTAIETSKALLKFSNVDDHQSIAFWAINRKKAFTRIEESILIKFKDLVVSNPNSKDYDYLPKPEVLFENIKQDLLDDEGFWLDLNGIFQYIPLVDQQFLDNEDPSEKRKYFNEKYQLANATFSKAQKEFESIERFYKALHQISGLQENISTYKKKREIESFNIIQGVPKDQSDFDDILTQYDRKKEIIEECEKAKEEWEKANQQYKEFEQLANKFSGIQDINTQLLQEKGKLKRSKEEETKIIRKISCIKYFLIDESDFSDIASQLNQQLVQSSLALVFGTIKQNQTELSTDRNQIKSERRFISKQLNDSILKLQENNQNLPQVQNENLTKANLEEVETQYEKNEFTYKQGVESLVNDFLSHDSYKYQNEVDWRRLAKDLLPEVFKSNQISEDQFNSEIEERLQAIIDKDKVISDRKVQLLLDVFGKVEEVFNSFSSEVDRLRLFFNDHDKRITGGHKVSIKLDRSTDYPIGWIFEFKKQMREKNANRIGGLFSDNEDTLEFKSIIQNSFKQCGGKKADPKIEDLLNPKKYFELSFSLQKDNIKNSGSTGQVYSAIALLCIARISLIEQGEGTKKRKGVRFMPVDEAEGLGSNYEMLSNIAKNEDYQIVSMSINPVGEFENGSHYIYMLNEPEDDEIRINGVPFAQFTEEGLSENVREYIVERYDE